MLWATLMQCAFRRSKVYDLHMAAKSNVKNLVATVCMVLVMLFVASLYIVGCIEQQQGKYRGERDKRDHVKGQIQPVPHEIAK